MISVHIPIRDRGSTMQTKKYTRSNIEYYAINIRDKLTDLVGAVARDGCLNLHNLNIHAEFFYAEFLNLLYGWNLINENAIEPNAKGIDLVDERNKVFVQVSSEHTRKKIQESLDKCNQDRYSGFHFYFVVIVNKYHPRDGFNVPPIILFNSETDVIDVEKIQHDANALRSIDSKKNLSDTLDKYWSQEQIPMEKLLADAFTREINRNPSMRMERMVKNILPRGHFVSMVRMEQNDTSCSGKSNAMLFHEAISLLWKKKNNHPLCLFGIGGLGKTVTLLTHNWELPVVYIPLRNLKKTQGIEDYIKACTLNSIDAYWQHFVKLCNDLGSNEKQVIIIIDGFNEISKDHRDELYKELNTQWVDKQNVQLVLSSRYNVNTEYNCPGLLGLELEPLDRKQIKKYLDDFKIQIHESNPIWNVLTTPLMLNLYAQSQRLFRIDQEQESNLSGYISPRKAGNAGTVVWNYLQSEIMRFIASYQKVAIPTIAIMFITPYIAFRYRQNNVFSVSKREFNKFLLNAMDRFNEARSSEKLPDQIINSIMEDGSKDPSSTNYFPVLTKNLCIFYEHNGRVEFMHQHFRDALAAIFIYLAFQMCIIGPDVLVSDTFDKYVESFFVDILSAESGSNLTWRIILDSYRDEKMSNSEIVSRLLHIHKTAFGNDLSSVDFSNIDLSNVSLSGFVLDNSLEGNFKNTKLTSTCFFGEGHQMSVSSVSWRPKTCEFLSASHDRSLRIWNYPIKSTLISYGEPHRVYIRAAEWNPVDPNVFASAGDDQKLILWTYNNDEWHSNVLARGNGWIRSIAWSQDGKMIAFGTNTGHLYCYSLSNGLSEFKSFGSRSITTLYFSVDNRIIAGGGDPDEGFITVWRIDNVEAPEQIVKLDSRVLSAQLDFRQNNLVAITMHSGYYIHLPSDSNNTVHLTETSIGCSVWKRFETVIQSASVRFVEDTCYCVAFSIGNIEVHKGIQQNGETHFNIVASQPIDTHELGVVACSAWNNDCTQFVFGSRNGSVWHAVFIQDEATYDRLLPSIVKAGTSSTARCSAWNENGSHLAAGYDDNSVRLWDIKNKKCVRVLLGHLDSVKAIAWSKSNRSILASGSDDGTICVWNTEDSKALVKRITVGSPVNCLAWLHNGHLLAGTDIGYVFLCDSTSNNDNAIKLEGHDNSVYSLLVTSDEKYALSAGNDKYICLWNISENRCPVKLPSGHEKETRALAWGKDEKSVYTASNDQTIRKREFDLDTSSFSKEPIVLPPYHTNFVYSIASSSDRKIMVSGSTDANIGVWDMEFDQFLAGGKAHHDFVWNVSVSPLIDKNCYVASCSSDGTIAIWSISQAKNRNEFEPLFLLEAVPGVSLIACNLSDAIIQDKRLKELLRMNGGIV